MMKDSNVLAHSISCFSTGFREALMKSLGSQQIPRLHHVYELSTQHGIAWHRKIVSLYNIAVSL
jgi:hypothetical protein